MFRVLYFCVCAMFLFCSEVLAFPTSVVYREGEKDFEYKLTADDGVTATDDGVGRAFDVNGERWNIGLNIREDLTGDDELTIKASAYHISFPSGPRFEFEFKLADDVDYATGKHELVRKLQLPHPIVFDDHGYDAFSAILSYRVGGSFDDDFVEYELILTGRHFSIVAPGTLALFGLGLGGLAAMRRIGP